MSETYESNLATDGHADHDKHNDHHDHHEPGFYEIRVRGHLGDQWATWFAGLTLTLDDNGDTLLTGQMVDQAALHGLLRKVRDLGMPLLSVIRAETGQEDTPDAKH